MQFSLVFLLFATLLGVQSQGTTDQPTNLDRKCGNDLSNLWLDVVVVVDNSVGMTHAGLTQVSAQIATVFGQGTKIGSSDSPRTTRVGLVTYNHNATTLADLDQFQSYNDLLNAVFSDFNATGTTESFIDVGIEEAEKVLSTGRANDFRSNYKQVILIYASEYRDDGTHDPIPAAQRLKDDGVSIITVAFDQDGSESLLNKLAELSTPGYGFSNKDRETVKKIEKAMTQINCFCPNLWFHYRSDLYSESSEKYGTCIYPAPLQAGWTPAKFACQNMAKNAFLVTEDSQQKHDFVFEVVKNGSSIQPPYIYHIGLSFSNGNWSWQQPAGQALKPLSNSIWNPEFPTSASTSTAVLDQQQGAATTSEEIGWQNLNPYTVSKNYVCEVATCDTDNYCS